MADVQIQIGKIEEDSDALDLVLDQTVAGPAPSYLDCVEDAQPYPIAVKLLALESISALLLQEQKLTLCRSNSAGSWQDILVQVQPIITDHFAELPSVEPQRQRTEQENQAFAQVQEVLNSDLNPMIASHGGFIEVLDVKADTAFIRMSGGCQGCGQAAMTLKQGVERVIYEKVPEITRILDTTDHAAGTNPFYSP